MASSSLIILFLLFSFSFLWSQWLNISFTYFYKIVLEILYRNIMTSECVRQMFHLLVMYYATHFVILNLPGVLYFRCHNDCIHYCIIVFLQKMCNKLFCSIRRLIPHLKYIIENAPPELRQLRGKTLECFSLIGLAVGREKVRDN